MYLRGSKWSYTRRRKNSNPWRILLLLALVGVALYFNQVIVPATPPLFIPTPTSTRSPESYVTDAEALLKEGKLTLAVQAYRQAIQADPKNAANYITLARLLIYTGNYQEAVTNAENALIASPNNSMAHAVRGWGLGFLGNYLDAEAAVRRSIELDANNAAAYAYLSEVLALEFNEGLGDLTTKDKAIEASRQAMQMAPNTLETHRARGIILEMTGNNEEAIKEFEAAVAINPNIADLHLALGRNYRFLQQYDKAVEEFNRANGLNPTDPIPLLYISRTYASVGEYAKAIQYGQQAITISPGDPLLYGNLGVMYYRNHQYPDAVAALRLAIRGGKSAEGVEVKGLPLDYGRVAEYYYTYGLTQARLGECGEALQISQLLMQGVPNDDVSVFNAQEMINICKEAANAPTSQATALMTVTPGAGEATPTPTR